MERRTRVPVVELPIGATEDRVAGTLDLETALTAGRKRFEPGLLADAHRGILYVDEVNLLDDHVVDLLLDSAAMGVNTMVVRTLLVTPRDHEKGLAPTDEQLKAYYDAIEDRKRP